MTTTKWPKPTAGMPLRRGQCVALGMADGCQVGIVERVDDTFITITHFDWLIGYFCGAKVAYRAADVERIMWADWTEESDGFIDFHVDPLGEFQTIWNRAFADLELQERVRAARAERREMTRRREAPRATA